MSRLEQTSARLAGPALRSRLAHVRDCDRTSDSSLPRRALIRAFACAGVALLLAASGCERDPAPNSPNEPANAAHTHRPTASPTPIEASRAPALPPIQPERQPDILLISVDTLRPDHLSLYGYPRPTSPAIDRFFAEAEIYEAAYSAEASTSPSVVSMLTGLYPARHRLRLFYQRISPDVHVLSDYLAAAGYQTAAVVSNVVLTSEAIGLSTRFDHYDDFVDERDERLDVYERRAGRTTDAAIAWLEGERDPTKSHLLWVHYIDPHGPYGAPEGEAPRRFESDTRRPIDPRRVIAYQRLPGVNDANAYVDRYDEEIAYADREIGRLLDHYEALGLARDAIVIFTADHGENLYEHDVYFSHGHQVWNSIMRVPLMIRHPEGRPARIRTPVSLVDLTPTLLAHLGIALPEGLDGIPLAERTEDDLISLEAGGKHPDAQGRWAYRHHRALVSGDQKWFASVDRDGRLLARGRIDLRADPGEIAPQPWQPGAKANRLLDWIENDPDPAGLPQDTLEGHRVSAPKVAPGRTDEELRALRALGYVE